MSEEIDKQAIKEMIELSEQLPNDTFAAVPDEDTVDIRISGAFSRSIQKTLEYVKMDYKGDDFDKEKVTDLDVAVWTLMMLTNEFNAQAGLQKKTKIYDRKHFLEALMGNADPAIPLDDDAIALRIKVANEESQRLLKEEKEKKKD